MDRILVFARDCDQCERYLYAVEYMGFKPVRGYSESDPADYSGVIIIGGADVDPSLYGEKNTASINVDREYDTACFDIISRSLSSDVPVLGICRGIQVINVFFGGSLNQDIPGHRIENGMHDVAGVRDPRIHFEFPEKMTTNSRHHQSVKKPGNGIVVTARAVAGTVEACEHISGKVLAVQWHPERMLGNMPGEGEDGKIVFGLFRRMIDLNRRIYN